MKGNLIKLLYVMMSLIKAVHNHDFMKEIKHRKKAYIFRNHFTSINIDDNVRKIIQVPGEYNKKIQRGFGYCDCKPAHEEWNNITLALSIDFYRAVC